MAPAVARCGYSGSEDQPSPLPQVDAGRTRPSASVDTDGPGAEPQCAGYPRPDTRGDRAGKIQGLRRGGVRRSKSLNKLHSGSMHLGDTLTLIGRDRGHLVESSDQVALIHTKSCNGIKQYFALPSHSVLFAKCNHVQQCIRHPLMLIVHLIPRFDAAPPQPLTEACSIIAILRMFLLRPLSADLSTLLPTA